MLGYRTYFTVGGQDVLDTTLPQLFAWLKRKRYDAGEVRPGTVSTIGPGVESVLTNMNDQDGSRSVLFQLREKKETGTWLTQLVAHQPGSPKRDPWVWLDVDNPEGRHVAVPRLARALLEVLDARDGAASLSPSARMIGVDEVPELLDAVRDERRRGPVFVAGTHEALPLQPWQDLTNGLLRETTGLASAYLLDAEATERFADLTGRTHAVAPGTLRSFLRAVDLGDEVDARRHRVLTTQSIVRESGRRVVRMLGQRARDTTLVQPLPAQALRVEERLLRQADEDFLEQARTSRRARGARSPATTDAAPSTVTSIMPATPPTISAPSSGELGGDGGPQPASPTLTTTDVELLAALRTVADTVYGPAPLTVDLVLELGQQAQDSASLQELKQRMRHETEGLQLRVTELRTDATELGQRLEDEQAEHAQTAVDLREAQAELQALRVRMLANDQGDAAWAPLNADEQAEPVPDSFDSLLATIETLNHVRWTGDDDVTVGLDAKDPLGRWAATTWDALRALDAYVAWRLDGNQGSVDHYLRNTPQGMHGFSANRHAADETDSVRSTAKYAEPRTLPVPDTVEPAGRVFMGAHLRIAKSGMTSPRLHYHDAYETDRKIYVGYIGPHLPSRRTN